MGVDDSVLPELTAQLEEVNSDMEGIQASLLDEAMVKHSIVQALSDIEGEKAEIEMTLSRMQSGNRKALLALQVFRLGWHAAQRVQWM